MFHRIADSSPKFLKTVFWYEMFLSGFVGKFRSVLGTNMSLITNSHCELIGRVEYWWIARLDRRHNRRNGRSPEIHSSSSNFSTLDYHRPHKPHNFIGLIQYRCACILPYESIAIIDVLSVTDCII